MKIINSIHSTDFKYLTENKKIGEKLFSTNILCEVLSREKVKYLSDKICIAKDFCQI